MRLLHTNKNLVICPETKIWSSPCTKKNMAICSQTVRASFTLKTLVICHTETCGFLHSNKNMVMWSQTTVRKVGHNILGQETPDIQLTQ